MSAAVDAVNSRWAGRALVAGLCVLAALNVVRVARDWRGLANVTTPRGSTAPDFTAPLLDGGTLHLAAERGHPVALVFWAPWCGPCRAELPGVERVARTLRQPGHTTRLFAVDTEGDRDTAVEAKQQLGLTLPIALDDGSAGALYRVTTIPHTVLLDANGHVAQLLRGAHSEAELAAAIARLEAPR